MVDKAKSMYPRIKFFVMDACALQWEGYFNAVFSNTVLHFIKDQDVLLDNIYKALKNNGLILWNRTLT
jgi:trans-aconitate methyltransferase